MFCVCIHFTLLLFEFGIGPMNNLKMAKYTIVNRSVNGYYWLRQLYWLLAVYSNKVNCLETRGRNEKTQIDPRGHGCTLTLITCVFRLLCGAWAFGSTGFGIIVWCQMGSLGIYYTSRCIDSWPRVDLDCQKRSEDKIIRVPYYRSEMILIEVFWYACHEDLLPSCE